MQDSTAITVHTPQPAAPAPAAFVDRLGYPAMDAIHDEFDQLLLRATACADRDILPLLRAIDAHLRDHFAQEERWMSETDFPPRDCHMREHAEVLTSSAQVLRLAEDGSLAPSRGFLKALVDWFPAHATYLDSALATWMCKRAFGGRPVVLHRSSELAQLRAARAGAEGQHAP